MKPTMQEKEEALSVVQVLFSYGFKGALSYGTGECGYWKWIHTPENEEVLDALGIEMTCGASKVCIIKDSERWVIKIGFLRATNKHFVQYGSAIDFCAREAEYYAKAVDARCERYFAATYKCGEVDGVEIFLQEKVKVCEERFEDRVYKYISSSYRPEDYEDEDEMNDCIADDMENCDSESYIRAILEPEAEKDEDIDIEELIEFVDEHDINDLHPLNWGITNEGKVVLIDFSGY